MAVKKKDHENLSKSSIQKVISLLEAQAPITKKEACEILNISYNTTRLKSIIDDFKAKQTYQKEQRAKRRGKPLDEHEITTIIRSYLDGDPMDEISERCFRSVGLIKKALVDNGIPLREPGATYFNPPLIPENGIKEDYSVGDLVYSARYSVPAEIKGLFQIHKDHGKVYSIWLLGEEQQFAYQPYYELADLTHVQGKL